MPIKAQQAGEHLERLERQHGMVTPRLIVDDARPQQSLLHKCFEWNDAEAAEKYRETQAGYLLRNLIAVKVTSMQQEQSDVRAFVSVVKNDNNCFVSVATAMSNEDMRQQILENALSELQAIKKKYTQLEELAEVFAALDRIVA
jgi:hypothetical protein